jgi:hypothetical protein
MTYKGLTQWGRTAPNGATLWLEVQQGETLQPVQSAAKTLQCRLNRPIALRTFTATATEPDGVTALRLVRMTISGEPADAPEKKPRGRKKKARP